MLFRSDVYWEYTGTSLITYNKVEEKLDADATYAKVKELDETVGIVWLDASAANNTYALAMRKVEEALAAKRTSDRGAHFVACLTLAWPDGHMETFRGEVHGTLIWPPRGDKGFGYDPMFLPEGETRTFGQIEPVTEHGMSHRARAFEKLVAACFR